jgi:oligoendopeptidase F
VPLPSNLRTVPHRFLPEGLQVEDTDRTARLYDDLEARELSTAAELEAFILDGDELTGFLSEAQVRAYIDMTCDTRNPEFDARFQWMVDTIVPVVEERGFRLKRRILAAPALPELPESYDLFLRHVRAEVELFREENVPLLMEEMKLAQEFERITGAQTASFRGETLTLQQLRRYFEEPDRATREEAWRATAEVQLADAPVLDSLFDRMVDVRRRIAANAGCADYADYRFRQLKRFDYTREDSLAFDEAIARHAAPVLLSLRERRRRLLGVETLRPWDLVVDPSSSPPPRPFETVERLQEGCARIFERLDPELAYYFREMIDQGLLDLANRPGKGPGGYMNILPHSRVPFIFMNAVGTHRDVEILLHEAGHGFNYYLARDHLLDAYRFPPPEFGEVGSMAMELLARLRLDEFYAEPELGRLLDEQLRAVISLLPTIGMVDLFQHRIYADPGAGAAECHRLWLELDERFRPGLDWSGLERYRSPGWQFLHVFTIPFYFIEYAIAQLAALRIWLRFLEEPDAALRDYKRALALGGSKPLPEIFHAAGVELALHDAVVREVVESTARHFREADDQTGNAPSAVQGT